MKIKTLLFCSLLLMASLARAQYVSIPDTAFGGWLYHNGFSSCLTGNSISGWQLDTLCPAVVNDDTMILNGNNQVSDLQGVQYFRHLTYFDCSDNLVPVIPGLSSVLVTLHCNNNDLTALPPLPSTLRYLECSLNNLHSLPALPNLLYLDCSENSFGTLTGLPATLTYLNCDQDTLSSLPSLPTALTSLICSDNTLTSLPALPPGLKSMDCSLNALTALPALPATLTTFTCYLNQITSLPALPDSLTTMDCRSNALGTLPALPPLLNTLICSHNQITSLPALPDTLVYLDCGFNQLGSLPALPDSLLYFDCSYNADLQCMPHLGVVVSLNFSNTAITCLPDTPADNANTIPGITICTALCVAGINETNAAGLLSVYPNPGNSTVHISYSSAIHEVYLSDMTGKTILTANGDGKNALDINVSPLATGIYILSAATDEGKTAVKVVRE